jgi:biotin transport system substrate-specific component
MAEALLPHAGVWHEVALALGGSLLVALGAQLRVVLPFSPVPVTGQTLAVLLVGTLYGSRRGVATVLTYLAAGASGLPVFAGGGFGLAWLIGPSGGYLAGFVPAAFLVGYLSERGWDSTPWTAAAAMVVGNLSIYALGVLWLSRFVGWGAVLTAGVLPFLAGDAVKIALAAVLLPAARKGWDTASTQRLERMALNRNRKVLRWRRKGGPA